MAQFINPFSDWGFKKIFGQEINKDLLIDFLNQVFEDEHVIKDLQFLDKEQLGIDKNDRTVIYDVLCLTDTGKRIIVEMQNRSQDFFIDRSIFYVSRTISLQGEKGGEWEYQFDAVYGVYFLNFSMPELDGRFRTDAVLADMKTHKRISDKLRFVFLQLPLFKEGVDECVTNFEKWIYVLTNMELLDRMPWLAKNEVFKKLAEIGDLSKLSREDREKYDTSIKHLRDTIAVYNSAERKGRAKGLALAAKNMKSKGIPLEDIQEMTGLSPEEIEKL